jgi:hypothetical protein
MTFSLPAEWLQPALKLETFGEEGRQIMGNRTLDYRKYDVGFMTFLRGQIASNHLKLPQSLKTGSNFWDEVQTILRH